VAGEHLEIYARRVVSGFDDNGKSTIESDGPTTRRVATPAFTVHDIWETESLPVPMMQGTAEGDVTLLPSDYGFIYRVTIFPPDDEWSPRDFSQSLDGMGGRGAEDKDARTPGMHVHPTVDIVTVVSGEVYVVFESAETLLKQGDTAVLRGAMHAWSNRSDRPCMVTSLMMGAKR
jgi:mannose-6-phosphate isomerase-like protein (cupin superfamily)